MKKESDEIEYKVRKRTKEMKKKNEEREKIKTWKKEVQDRGSAK